MAIAAQKTENAVCLESWRGGYSERLVRRAAYAAPLKKAAGRLALKRYRKRVRERDFATADHSGHRPSRRLRLGGKRRRRKTNAAAFDLAERREVPGRMAIASQKTENAVCWESRRGGDIKRHAGRAAYAAPLTKATGRLTQMRYRKRARKRDSAPACRSVRRPSRRLRLGGKPVSYTHLTLPTKA